LENKLSLSRTIFKISQIIGQIFAVERGSL